MFKQTFRDAVDPRRRKGEQVLQECIHTFIYLIMPVPIMLHFINKNFFSTFLKRT